MRGTKGTLRSYSLMDSIGYIDLFNGKIIRIDGFVGDLAFDEIFKAKPLDINLPEYDNISSIVFGGDVYCECLVDDGFGGYEPDSFKYSIKHEIEIDSIRYIVPVDYLKNFLLEKAWLIEVKDSLTPIKIFDILKSSEDIIDPHYNIHLIDIGDADNNSQ